MANFPVSDYEEIVPETIIGSGADRYLKALQQLGKFNKTMSAEDGFEVLKGSLQTGPVWTTELSLLYNAVRQELYCCLDRRFDAIVRYDFDAENMIHKTHMAVV